MSDCLPEHVVEEILSRLPLREAVRTSVLSRAWRHRWQSVPILSLDANTPAAVIDSVLLTHSAPIKGFSAGPYVDHIDRCLLLLSRRHTDALTSLCLHCSSWLNSPISSSALSSFRSLTYLSLHDCFLSPPVLPDFPLLRTLILSHVYISNDHQLSALVSGCPSLEDLSLISLETFGCLCIHNPNLRSFHLEFGYCEIITFVGGQILEKVSVRGMDLETVINLAEFFGNSVCDGTLELTNFDIEDLMCAFAIPESIPSTFQQLKVLTMDVDWDDRSSIRVVLCLMRSSPNLRQLCLTWPDLNFGSLIDHRLNYGLHLEGGFWNKQGLDPLDKLRTVEMRRTIFTESEMGFMQFVLKRAPVLEKLILVKVTESISLNKSTLEVLKKRQKSALEVLNNCQNSTTQVQLSASRF